MLTIRQQAFVGWLISLVTGIIKRILVIFNQGNTNLRWGEKFQGGKKEEEWNREGGIWRILSGDKSIQNSKWGVARYFSQIRS